MIARFVSALIIDQEKESARVMGNIVKELFNKVFTQSDLKLVPGDLTDIKPQVVLLNLTIAQRSQNLELADIIGTMPSLPLLLGYTDSHEPELLAHALESGFQDLFMKPFDEDIIASKINKFYQHEKTLKRDIAYTVLRPALPAKIKLQVEIKACDENGITLFSRHHISKGTAIKLPPDQAREITGDEKSEFMIAQTWIGDAWGEHYSYAELKNPDEARSASLRRFILGKNS